MAEEARTDAGRAAKEAGAGQGHLAAVLRIRRNLVERYLRSRGITLPAPPTLCLHGMHGFYGRHPSGERRPVMVGLVTHTETGIIGVIRTWLAVDGSAKASLDPPRIFTGAVKGGAVRLARLDPALELVVGEGIETVLSVMQVTGLPGWAALSRKAATNSSRRRAPPSGRPNQRREQRQFQRATGC
jgi:hypothetical protein